MRRNFGFLSTISCCIVDSAQPGQAPNEGESVPADEASATGEEIVGAVAESAEGLVEQQAVEASGATDAPQDFDADMRTSSKDAEEESGEAPGGDKAVAQQQDNSKVGSRDVGASSVS